ncbi:amidohydrolase family protein [Nocardioides panacisoli]|uniref:Amidohydrolase family protein n=1 Tax=Nocardioides panacisoli TaxID=627624 RepID=A0ABP7HRC8_9ACTN
MTQSLSGIVPSIIDAHIHQWDPFTTPREASRLAPLYDRAPRLMDRLLPVVLDRGTRELILTARHAARPYLPADYAADVAGTVAAVGVPVEAAIHIQCGWHEGSPVGETEWLETLPFGRDGNPRLAAIVAEADPREPGFADLLDAHAAASGRFRGVRFMTTWHPDKGVKNWIDEDGVMKSSAFLRGFAALAERGLTFDSYVYSHQLGEVVTLAKEYPDTTIVLDHYGPPVGVMGPMGRSTARTPSDRAALLDRWRDAIAEVAACPNVVAKHSGIAFPSLGHREPGLSREQLAEKVRPLVDHTTDVFGEDRLVFGSNYPMDKSITTYPAIVGALVDLLAPRGPDLLRKVFRDNAIATYRL